MRNLTGVFVEQEEQQVLLVSYVVVQGRRPDADLGGQPANGLAPAALALLTATFPAGKARVRAFGAWSAMNAAGGAFGVLIGGLLTEYAGWRWVMFVNVPMAAGALALAWRALPLNDQARRLFRRRRPGSINRR